MYPRLSGAGVWLRGGELAALAPQASGAVGDLRVLFYRLSTFFDTGPSFTHRFLVQIAQSTEGVRSDLGYLPPPSDAALFSADNVPWLLGTGSKLGPSGFDVLGLSLSLIQEIVNLPTVLTKSGIPLARQERLDRADLPLVILGGASALYSAAAWDWVDGVFVGEDPAAIRKLLEICRDSKREGLSKRETLARLESLSGFIRPDSEHRTRKAFVDDLEEAPSFETGPLLGHLEHLGTSPLQISEGCPCFCSFCAESWDRKPYRERGLEAVVKSALRAKAEFGLDSVDLYSFNFNMHSEIYPILWELVPYFRTIGLKSQRFDLLAHDPRMALFQHALEKASFTCGLEGISDRMRCYLNKNLSERDVLKGFEGIFVSRPRELKVFLIATGKEEPQDFDEFRALLLKIAELRQAKRTSAKIVFSMTPLVRFPWTPRKRRIAWNH